MKEEIFPKQMLSSWRNRQHGVTLIEILVVVAVVAVLSVSLFAGYTRQLSRARDATRKGDLEKIRTAFEDYYNDHQCYPDLGALSQCGSTTLAPYLKNVPCDPADNQPYVYFALNDNTCTSYRVLVRLENTNDPNIQSMGCDATNGCYYEDPAYNFGIAMGGALTSADWGQGPGAWGIAPNGVCNYYLEDVLHDASCPTEYQTYDACFAVSGCTGNCSQQDVPLYLRCER